MKQKLPRLNVEVPAEVEIAIKRIIAERGIFQQDWLFEAVISAIEREGRQIPDMGPLRGLNAEDRRRGEEYLKFLRTADGPIKNKVHEIWLHVRSLLEKG